MEAAALALSGTYWMYLVMFLLAFGDQFFPPIPSDPVLISLVVAAHQLGYPNLWLLVPAAVLGAFLGNIACYFVGLKIGTERFKVFRTEKARASIARAQTTLAERGMGYIIVARFIPVARIAIIMTVGAMRYPLSRFVIASAISFIFWGLNAAAIGSIFGQIEQLHPALAILVGVATGLLVGMLLDRGIAWYLRRRTATRAA